MNTAASNPTSDRLILVLAILGHLGAGIFYAAAGLVAPLWAVLLLWALWLVLLWQLVRIWRRRPLLSLAVPVVAVALFFAVITLGEQMLGWTA